MSAARALQEHLAPLLGCAGPYVYGSNKRVAEAVGEVPSEWRKYVNEERQPAAARVAGWASTAGVAVECVRGVWRVRSVLGPEVGARCVVSGSTSRSARLVAIRRVDGVEIQVERETEGRWSRSFELHDPTDELAMHLVGP